jgi:TonB-dependent receptor
VDWSFPFHLFGNDASVKFGGEYRRRTRDFAARRLNWKFIGGVITDIDQAVQDATIVANARRVGEMSIDEVVEPGDLYDASDDRSAGYLLFDLPLTGSLQAIAGARVEKYALGLHSRGDTLASRDQTDVAPSLNLVYSLGSTMKLRGAVSRTVDRPEFRELAPFQFTEATSLRQIYGNENLVPAKILSTDLRWDWFPRPGEMLSLGAFYKKLKNPIEQVFVAAASAAYSFQNAVDARILGVELDSQLGLSHLSPLLENYSVQLNYSWIDSKVNVRQGERGFEPTNLTRPLEGQAPYVFNAGINYANPSGLEAGVFLNRFGARLTAAGGLGLPDIYEQPRNALDATVGFPLTGGATAKIKATNLLDAKYLFEQSADGVTLVQRQYSVGRTVSVGLSWEF